MNLVHIESRKSKRRNSEFEIFVDCDSNHEQLNEIIQLLRKHVNVVDMEPPDNSCLREEGEKVVSEYTPDAELNNIKFEHLFSSVLRYV